MRKKLAALLSIIFTACLFAGCTPPPVLELADHLPWANETDTMFYEKTEYTIIRKDTADNTLATGLLSYEIDKIKKNENEYEDKFKLSMRFSLTYTDGLTDTYESDAYFTSFFLTPIKSDKTVKIESTIDYGAFKIGPESSYNYSAVYEDTTIQGVEYKAGASGKIGEKEITMPMSSKGAGSVDNEYVYFYIRALKNLKENSSTSFSLYNVYAGLYSGLQGEKPVHTRLPVSMSVAKDPVDIAIDSALVSTAGAKNIFMGVDNTVKAYKTTLAIQALNKGTDVVLYYSQPKSESVDVVPNSRKVLLGIDTQELSQSTSKLLYTMSYRLKSYTTAPTV